MSTTTTSSAEHQTRKASPARSSRRFPGPKTRLAIAMGLVLTGLFRVLWRVESLPFPLSDRAFGNMMSFLFGALAVLLAWQWFAFHSDYSKAARRTVMFGGIGALALFFAIFKLDGFRGDMVVERFRLRWLPAADRQLDEIISLDDGKPIDLTTTTPADFPEFLGPGRRCWIEDPGLATDWTAQPPKLLWKHEIGAGWSAFAAVNGYAVTMEQRGDQEWVSCYEIATGKPIWGRAIEARHAHPLGGVGPRSTPTIAGGHVYALGGTGRLQCLDGSNGKLIWEQDLLQLYGVTQAESEAEVLWGRAASPLVVDGLVIVPAGGKTDPANKRKPTSLVAFRAEDGTKVWEAGADQISYSSPVLATLAGQRQVVIVNEMTVTGHDVETGRQLWGHKWPGSSSSSASVSQAVPLAGDMLLLTKGYGGGAELLKLVAGGSGS
ncbi:MAG TPA: PQQ-binding-like beta-propeller repeat protein, partial [Pirellulaceae bacterium]|nr:PQQ-binding-like beta-propeller repeat protein [Pirellulaceae bacterium]